MIISDGGGCCTGNVMNSNGGACGEWDVNDYDDTDGGCEDGNVRLIEYRMELRYLLLLPLLVVVATAAALVLLVVYLLLRHMGA